MLVPSLGCIFCGGGMQILPSTHKEFYTLNLSYDGTRRWFLCTKCEGVFGKDKVMNTWSISPDTYVRFVEEGKIKDKLGS
jgi:hypothetical protein